MKPIGTTGQRILRNGWKQALLVLFSLLCILTVIPAQGNCPLFIYRLVNIAIGKLRMPFIHGHYHNFIAGAHTAYQVAQVFNSGPFNRPLIFKVVYFLGVP